jgi:hypothetical protein
MSYVDTQPTDRITQGGLGLIVGFVSEKEQNLSANISGRCEKRMNIQTSNSGAAVCYIFRKLYTHTCGLLEKNVCNLNIFPLQHEQSIDAIHEAKKVFVLPNSPRCSKAYYQPMVATGCRCFQPHQSFLHSFASKAQRLSFLFVLFHGILVSQDDRKATATGSVHCVLRPCPYSFLVARERSRGHGRLFRRPSFSPRPTSPRPTAREGGGGENKKALELTRTAPCAASRLLSSPLLSAAARILLAVAAASPGSPGPDPAPARLPPWRGRRRRRSTPSSASPAPTRPPPPACSR